MNYLDSIEFLFGIRLFGQKLGLETMRQLLRLMGDPQRSLRFIHVAGTNGKGSVAAMCHSALTAAGYKTGLYTSPHLVSFCERFQICQQPISELDVVRLVEQIRPLLEKVGSHPEFRPPTFFETVTAMALQYFREQNVDIVVWETGLGGRLDATNVVTPLVSVITNIAFDHTQYLGETLAQIAYEKCGIIKPGVPAVAAATGADALAVIRKTCDDSGCSLKLIEQPGSIVRLSEDQQVQRLELTGDGRRYGTIELPLLGEHQATNCATAVAALEQSGLEIGPAQMRDGLARTAWPGRFQIVGESPTVVLDGAHNAAATEKLVDALREHFDGRRLAVILGVLRDKNYEQMCRLLAPLAEQMFCVPVNSERTSDPAELARLCRLFNRKAVVSVCGKVTEAYRMARSLPDHVIVITGSLFLIGESLARLGLPVGSAAVSERELVLQ
jgi:dihydrofolate synthase/folylpolyglutamate synthase